MPSLLVRNGKSQLERLQHLIPEPLRSSFTFSSSSQISEKNELPELSWAHLIATFFSFATLTLHFTKIKCFISSYKQHLIKAFNLPSHFSTVLMQCKTFNFHLSGRFEQFSVAEVRQITGCTSTWLCTFK